MISGLKNFQADCLLLNQLANSLTCNCLPDITQKIHIKKHLGTVSAKSDKMEMLSTRID